MKTAQTSVSPTNAADWTFVAWNPLNDALQWPSDLPRRRFRVTLKPLEGSIWGIPAKWTSIDTIHNPIRRGRIEVMKVENHYYIPAVEGTAFCRIPKNANKAFSYFIIGTSPKSREKDEKTGRFLRRHYRVKNMRDLDDSVQVARTNSNKGTNRRC